MRTQINKLGVSHSLPPPSFPSSFLFSTPAKERGEKLDRMTYKTERMKKGAMDFAEAARALAERERTKKWWEF